MIKIVLEEETFFDCQACGRCCRADWKITIEASKAEQLRARGPELSVIQEPSGSWSLNTKSGQCAFLLPDQLCSIHKHQGEEAKPLSCQIFPYIFHPTPDGVHVGLSHYCPSVRAKHGRPLEEHRQHIEKLAAATSWPKQNHPIELRRGRDLGWRSYLLLEAEILERLKRGPGLQVFLSLFWGLHQTREVLGHYELNAYFSDYPFKLSRFVSIQAQKTAERWDISLERTELNSEPTTYLKSLVRRKFLIKNQFFLDGLLTLALVNSLLLRASNPETCLEKLELELSHGTGIQVSLLARFEKLLIDETKDIIECSP